MLFYKNLSGGVMVSAVAAVVAWPSGLGCWI